MSVCERDVCSCIQDVVTCVCVYQEDPSNSWCESVQVLCISSGDFSFDHKVWNRFTETKISVQLLTSGHLVGFYFYSCKTGLNLFSPLVFLIFIYLKKPIKTSQSYEGLYKSDVTLPD